MGRRTVFRSWEDYGEGLSTHHPKATLMNSIVYIVGLVVIILFVAGYFGLR